MIHFNNKHLDRNAQAVFKGTMNQVIEMVKPVRLDNIDHEMTLAKVDVNSTSFHVRLARIVA